MLKNLRTLCVGVAAAFSVASFAQTNVTNKLLNPDAEMGVLGWDVTFVDGGQVWNKQTKGQEKAVGYHGYFNWAFENWRGSGGLTNSSIFQLVQDLPNGTYVFGAYATATNDSWSPSIDLIEGVSLFANEYSIPVATHRVEGMNEKWAHAIKFNVAATVTEGTLTVGMKTEATNANFVTMDNATLYYFGEMSHNEALDAMAKIDIAASIDSVSAFLTAGKMNADTLASLQRAIEAAQGEVTAANAVELDEDLYWGKRQAKKSIAAYASLAEALVTAEEVAAMEWSDDYDETVAALEALNELIAACKEKYEAGTALNAEATTWATELVEAAALVALDSCFIIAEEYMAILDELPIGDEVGDYASADVEKAKNLYEDVMLVLSEAYEGAASAVTAMSECKALFVQIQQVIDNPIDYAQFPITITRSTTSKVGSYNLIEGAVGNNNDSYASYTSKTYRFTEPLTKIRFTVKETGNNGLCGKYPFFHLSEFELYDETGEKIELTADNLYSNACFNTLTGRSDGAGLAGMVDGDIATHFHTVYDNNYAVNEHHYFEVTLPEDKEYYGFSFVWIGRTTSSADINTRQFPAVLDIRYVSDAINELKQVIAEISKGVTPTQGTSVGFYNTDVNAYYAVLDKANALANADYASDSEINAVINELYAAKTALMESFVLPTPGKEYRVVSAVDFVGVQGVNKALTYYIDGNGIQHLRWETARPDSAQQVFTFEPMEAEDGKYIYAMKHKATGLYVNDYVDADGNVTASAFGLSETPGEVELVSYEKGMFTLGQGPLAGYRGDVNTMHAGGHSTGQGQSGDVIKWNTENTGTSWWYIRELSELPYAAQSISEELFKTDVIYTYVGVNTLVLTADKDCAFENLVVYNHLGEVVPATVTKNGAAAKVVLDVNALAGFSFEFTNAEGVAQVTVNGSLRTESASLAALQTAYDQTLAVAPVEGINVGQVSDLSEYNAALKAAEAILVNGAAEEEILAAKAALDSAKAHIVYNMPKEGVDYLILLGLDAIRGNHLTDMAVFADAEKSTLRWTYVSLTNAAYRWRFIDCGQLKNGLPAYYLENVATSRYATRPIDTNSVILVEDSVNARPFNLFFVGKDKVAVGDSYWADGAGSLHPMSHGSGASGNKGGYMITWGRTDAASAMYVVEAEKYISDVLHYITDVEDIEIADEQVAPAVKGIFDLFGRRIETPAATGIYIVDGKKQVIKK